MFWLDMKPVLPSKKHLITDTVASQFYARQRTFIYTYIYIYVYVYMYIYIY